jgi:hypothetical protein
VRFFAQAGVLCKSAESIVDFRVPQKASSGPESDVIAAMLFLLLGIPATLNNRCLLRKTAVFALLKKFLKNSKN